MASAPGTSGAGESLPSLIGTSPMTRYGSLSVLSPLLIEAPAAAGRRSREVGDKPLVPFTFRARPFWPFVLSAVVPGSGEQSLDSNRPLRYQ